MTNFYQKNKSNINFALGILVGMILYKIIIGLF